MQSYCLSPTPEVMPLNYMTPITRKCGVAGAATEKLRRKKSVW